MDQQRRSSGYADNPVGKTAPLARRIASHVVETERGKGDEAEQGRDRETAKSVSCGRPADLHVDWNECPGDNQKGVCGNPVDDDEEMLGGMMLGAELSDHANPFVER